MATNLPDRVSDQRNQIVDRVIADMEKGGFEWLKPWKDTAAPHNPLTGTTYKGGNRLHLAAMAMIRGYDDPRWVTFNQAKKAGWKIHKGAKSCVIEKWKMFAVKESDAKSENESDDPSVRHIPRCVGYWSVFNASEFDGVPPLPKLARNNDTEIGSLVDEVISSSRCPVREAAGNIACYYPSTDVIDVPPRDSFNSNGAFLVTLLHEMGHSTGHPDAVGRPLSGKFGSQEYAYEELVAEFSSMFSASDLGLSGDLDPDSKHYEQHVAYLQSWRQALNDDPGILFRASSAAEKATDSVIARYEEHVGHEAPGRHFLKEMDIPKLDAKENSSLSAKVADARTAGKEMENHSAGEHAVETER